MNHLLNLYNAIEDYDYRRLYLAFFFLLFFPLYGGAQMKAISDQEMAQVTAQSGLSITMDLAVSYTAGSIKVSDTDSDPADWIELNGFFITNGTDDYFSVKTPEGDPVTIDVATTNDGKTILETFFSTHTEPRYYHADTLVFCNQAIGTLDIDHVVQEPYTLRLASHTDNSTGIEWDLETAFDIDSFRYTYNDSGDYFAINGIHMAGYATGDTEDPTSWAFYDHFKIGDIETNPASFDIGTNADGMTVLEMRIPMQGTVRLEDVILGSQSFGPCAIDGLQVHRLSVGLVP